MEFLTIIEQNPNAAMLVAATGLLVIWLTFQGIASVVRAFTGRKSEKKTSNLPNFPNQVVTDIKRHE